MRGRPYEVRYAPIAETQIEGALLWWERNRRAAADRLARELHQVFDLLAVAPQIGRRVRLSGHPGVRRLLLHVSGYHVYYQLLDVDREVRIVYFRHARRRPLRAR